jgi:hypothetical protein
MAHREKFPPDFTYVTSMLQDHHLADLNKNPGKLKNQM